jgi:hypothetical protein
MKNTSGLSLLRSGNWSWPVLGFWSVLMLIAASINVRAYTNTFDTADSLNGWVHWWGAAMETRDWDPNMDADGNPNSGSLMVTVPFNRANGGDNQFSMWGSFSGTPNSWNQSLNGALYLSLELDLFWDNFSPTRPATGDYGNDFHYGFAVGAPVYGQISFDNHLVIAPADVGHWIHLSAPIDATAIGPNLTNIVGIWIKMWTGNDPNNSLETGTATFWVDNIRLKAIPPPPPDYVNSFDTGDSINGWTHWWGNATETREFDPALDADGNANSGSMKVSVPYSRSNGDNQFSMWGSFSGTPGTWNQPLDGTFYTNLAMDIYWDPSSPTRPATGDYGNDFRYGFAVGAPVYGQISFNNHTVIAPADVGHWFHVSSPIDLAAVGPNITNIVGIWIKMWTGTDPNTSLNDGTSIFWVDNITLSSKGGAPPPPPPTMGIARTKPGLRIFASAPGSQYQRQSIRTVNPAYSWVGATDPVTYSITINEYPGSSYNGFQTHLFIVPGSGIATGEIAPDWNEPNVVFLDIQNNAQGGAYASFRYKVNEPNGNSMIYGSGTIAGIGAPSVLGTWNLTFNPSGEITLTTPSGTSTNFMMPPDDVNLFAGPAYAYFGNQPNQTANIGQSALFGRFQITGVETPIDESFTTAVLDPNTWQVIAEDPAGVVPVPPDALLWLTWTLPAIGFVPQVTDKLVSPAWTDLSVTTRQISGLQRAVVLSSDLPMSATGSYFFRLVKPPATP